MTATRRLSAILAADVVGYSRLMQQDDQATVRALTERRAIFAERVAARRGRIINAPGDSILAEFPSVLDAVDCAVEIQTEIAKRNAGVPDPDRRMQFRIGVNLGDVIVEGEAIYGDGVNIAARLESLADYGGVALSANAYEQVRDKLPYRFADRGAHEVKNIARPVRVYAIDMSASGVAPRRKALPRRAALWTAAVVVAVAALLAVPRLVEREPPPAQAATLAVLPFANHSADPKREFFSDGLTGDVIDALGRFSALRVIAYNTVQAYKHRTIAPDQISRELGVRYVVQGSVRQADGRLRVAVELSDAMKGTLLWSERYDGEGKEVFEIQDRIVRNIAGSLAVKLSVLEQRRTAAKPPENLEAYELVLRAREMMRAVQRLENREARALIAQAIKLSPNYAEAHAAAAFAELQRGLFGWVEDPADALRRAEEAARRALAIDDPGANARAHAILGSIHSFTGHYEAALAEVDRAIELNPSDALARSLRGGVLLWTGRIEEAIAACEGARRFDPRLSAEGMFNLALAYYLAGRYREAVQTAVAVEPGSRTVFLRIVQAAALAQLGEAEEARREAEEARRLDPFSDLRLFGQRLVNPAHREKIQQGLRKAGL
ncbi:MAG TPA: adenylate/guanylate cyclase domain-containing protein [Burkholderiales bacterium]|nr:adenylate/guanylate cyclase domain-containing protein [Burkholderiales bacterium]